MQKSKTYFMLTTYIIIAITAIISYFSFENTGLKQKLIFNPYLVSTKKEWYRMLSSAFIHSDWNHLIFNMLTLYFFGPSVEGKLGTTFFIILYVAGAMVSSLPSYIKNKDNKWFNALGASGAVSAVLYAQILFNPLDMLYVFFIPMPSILFGVLYLFYSARMSKKNIDNIGHDAHFWGAVFGFTFPILLNPEYFSNFIDILLNLI